MHVRGEYAWLEHLDFMIVDLMALIVSFAVSYLLKFGDLGFLFQSSWMRLLVIISLTNLIIAFVINPYAGIFHRSYYQEIIRALKMTVYNAVTASVILYLFKIGADYSRVMFVVMYTLYFFLSLLFKYILKKLIISRVIVTRSTKQIPLFIIGKRETIRKTVAGACAGDFKLYDIRGLYLLDDDGAETEIDGIPVVRGDFVGYILSHNVHELLVDALPTAIAPDCYETLSANDVSLSFVIESAAGFQSEDQIVSSVGVYRTLTMGSFSFTPKQLVYFIIKRLLDILVGLIGIVLLIPVTIGVKLAYLLSGDRAKIFYRQRRVGQNGREIMIYKFRSMIPNAGEVLEQMLQDEAYRREWEENQKFNNDPRITKVGRFLRKTSLDELPQMINVLIGNMSLVGPRPLVEGELQAHHGLKLYEKVKPGITGWWGCNGRSNIDYKERLELEYYYVKNCSLYLDVLCILRTALAVLKRDGAQ